MRDRIVTWHLWRICDRLYRHEALQWVADWATARGRSFRIYGNGWEKHPTLSAFAAGPIQNGRELMSLYRASRINLQLMPAGFIHSRALDGLLAGGFFLTRRTAGDRCDPDIRLIGCWATARDGRSARQFMQEADATQLAAFQRVLERYRYDRNDLEHAFQTIRLDSMVSYAGEVFPDYDDIVFDNAASFARIADRFLENAELRRSFASSWRKIVSERFSYRATLRRFLGFAAAYFESMAGEPAAQAGSRSTGVSEPAIVCT